MDWSIKQTGSRLLIVKMPRANWKRHWDYKIITLQSYGKNWIRQESQMDTKSRQKLWWEAEYLQRQTCLSTGCWLVAREENIKRNNTMEKSDNVLTGDKISIYERQTDIVCLQMWRPERDISPKWDSGWGCLTSTYLQRNAMQTQDEGCS